MKFFTALALFTALSTAAMAHHSEADTYRRMQLVRVASVEVGKLLSETLGLLGFRR